MISPLNLSSCHLSSGDLFTQQKVVYSFPLRPDSSLRNVSMLRSTPRPAEIDKSQDAPAHRSSPCRGHEAGGLQAITAGGAGRAERSPSNINTLSAAAGMDGEVVAPADRGRTNGPGLMDQLGPAWAERPAL